MFERGVPCCSNHLDIAMNIELFGHLHVLISLLLLRYFNTVP